VPDAPTETLRRSSLRTLAGAARRRARLELAVARARRTSADLALFHEFASLPAGGGHQTLRALVRECRRRGVRIAFNVIPPDGRACLFNSFNFDAERLERFTDAVPHECRMVHRVGAVTSLYRGYDDGTDARVAELNGRFAEATIAISYATVDMYRTIGIELVAPRVIYNAVDPEIFNSRERVPFDRGRKTRIISVSWSDNPRKGGPVLRRLEDALDWSRYEVTFVGNTQESFERIRHLPPAPSHELAALLRQHDIFFTATQHDAYSNALVEALSCGLPAVYLDSGGSREAVKEAGFGFTAEGEIPALLDRLRDEYEDRQAAISLPSVTEIVDAYLEMLGLDDFVSG
jgi:glycosyltransferase involved in cell wall biosynthesis